ncbi:MAG: hypothetical protein WAV93_01665 [Bacteroidales bacterium]
MNKDTQIMIAKELKALFTLLVLGIILVAVAYGILYAAYKPPVNAPVPQEVKDRIIDQRYSSASIAVGDAFSNDSRYDIGITLDDILDDRINYIRMSHFKSDLQEKIKTAAIIIIISLIGGRYLILLVRWVSQTSKLDSK